MSVLDEAQSALPRVTATWEPPPPPPQPHVYAQRLLERVLAVPRATRRSRRHRRLIDDQAARLRQCLETLSATGRTTYEQERAIASLLEQFALEVTDLVTEDLGRKVGLDLATNLVPTLADLKGSS